MTLTTDAFPLDAGLPRLPAACDEELMTTLLRRHLRPSDGVRIEGCTLEGIGHRHGERSVLQYRARLSGADTATARVTGVLYADALRPGRARKLASALTAEAAAREGWRGPLTPVALLPEIDMLVQVYPFDRRLPALARHAFGPPPEVDGLLADLAGVRGARRWTSELVRYRPMRGAVLRHTLHAGVTERRFYVKLYPDAAEALAPRRLCAFDGAAGPFAVPRLLAEAPADHAVVLEEVPGTPLDRMLMGRAPIEPAMRRIATALVAFHRSVPLPERRFTVADEMADVHRAATRVRWALPDHVSAVARTVDSIARGLRDVAPAATHRDMKADHVLVDPERLALVDMDSCAAADPVLDAAALLARMYALPFEQPVGRRRVDAAMRAFADAYVAAAPPAWQRRLGPHYAGALLEVSGSLFRRQVPGWRTAVATLVAEAGRVVDDRAPAVAVPRAAEARSVAG